MILEDLEFLAEPSTTHTCDLPRRVCLRFANTVIGHLHLPATARPNSHGHAAPTSLLRVHAERALRVALAAWISAPEEPGPFRVATAVAAAKRQFDHQKGPQRRDDATPLTVAICSRARTASLMRALGAVLPSLREADELLVVLNAPDRHEPTIDPAQFPRVRFIEEPRPGLAWARNRALVESRTDIVLFTDDDCLPDPEWADAVRAIVSRNPDVDIVTGIVEPFEIATDAQQLFEDYRGFAGGAERRWIGAPSSRRIANAIGNIGGLGAGANFAVRRQLVSRIGPFDAALGAGTVTDAGEELEFFFRALKSHALLAQVPNALVRHDHRRHLTDLRRQLEGWSRGYGAAVARCARAFPEEAWALRSLLVKVALLHHARRVLMAPAFRALALAELRGLLGASRHYVASRANADRIAERTPSPAQDEWPVVERPIPSPPSTEGNTVRITAELRTLSVPAEVPPEASAAELTITWQGRAVGPVVLAAYRGAIGVDRILDAVIEQHGASLIGGRWDHAVDAMLTVLMERTASRR